LAVFANKKFFPPITNGLIALSAALLSISREPSNNTFFNPGKCFLAYSSALPNGLLERAFLISISTYSINLSMIGVSCLDFTLNLTS